MRNIKSKLYTEEATTKYYKTTNIRILIFVEKNEFTSKTFYLFLNSYVNKNPINDIYLKKGKMFV